MTRWMWRHLLMCWANGWNTRRERPAGSIWVAAWSGSPRFRRYQSVADSGLDLLFPCEAATHMLVWISSAGKGQGFDSPQVHEAMSYSG
jgi:hypothetical protein